MKYLAVTQYTEAVIRYQQTFIFLVYWAFAFWSGVSVWLHVISFHTCNANAQEISWLFLLQGAHATQSAQLSSAQWIQADRNKVSWITTSTEKRFNDKMYLMQNMVQRGGVCVYSMFFFLEGWAQRATATVQNMAEKIMCFYEGEFNIRNVDNSLSSLGRRKEQVWGSRSSTQCISTPASPILCYKWSQKAFAK